MSPVISMDAVDVCALEDILPDTGVCALVAGRQIALFRVGEGEEVYAIGNYDANSGANVLARGLVGSLGDRTVVASPIYKQHFDLRTGECLENPTASVRAYSVRVAGGRVLLDLSAAGLRKRPKRARLVVIGNGMAAMRAVEELLRVAPELYDIVVFGAEPYGNYNRILLSPVLSGEKNVDDIMLNAPAWYARHGIVLHAGDSVTAIDRRQRLVRSAGGKVVRYDRLLLATGSNPIVLPLPGVKLPGVVSFRDLGDVGQMMAAAKTCKRAVVIGGGLLGLEAANGLLRQGMDVTVVHLLDSLMERQLDPAAGALLKESLEKRGMKFVMPAQTAAILGDTRVTGLRFKDGTEIPADLVVMAVGIRPNVELAKSAGLRCDRGVMVDDTMQTYDPRIYAVGECVQHRNQTYGLVEPLWEQARVCATHLAELGWAKYRGSIPSTRLKVTGIDLYSAGDFLGGSGAEDLVLRDPKRGVYKRLVLREGKVKGAVLYGDVADGDWYFDLIASGRDVTAIRRKLLFGKALCEAA